MAPTDVSQVALDAVALDERSSQAFDRLLATCRDMASSTREQGSSFENLTRVFLQRDAEMARQFAEVFLWTQWPGRGGRPDTGIDLVGIEWDDMPSDGVVTADTPAVAIQCKFYKPGTRIQKANIDSFLAEAGKSPFKRSIVVDTTGVEWGRNAEEAITGQSKPVTRLSLDDFRRSSIDWSTFSLVDSATVPSSKPRKRLRDHQVQARDAVLEGFETHDRGSLIMACGTGKTFTSLAIAEQFAKQRGGSARILFMVPSLALMSQTLQEWSAEASLPFTAWSVCSDSKVNRKRGGSNDVFDVSLVDLKTPPTTRPEVLASSLQRHVYTDGLQVVFATYQSIDAVSKAQKLLEHDSTFDLVICDEAHRTTGVTLAGEKDSAFVRIHSDEYVQADKRLYMTATPRLFNAEVKNAASERDAVLASMDDESIYGPVFYRIGFGQAVSMGLLTDYKVAVLAISEDQVTGLFQQTLGGGGVASELPIPEVAKLVGCWNALSKRKNGTLDVSYGQDTHPMRRAVAFAKNIAASKKVAAEFPYLVSTYLQDLDNDDPSDNLEVQCEHVDGGMNAVERGSKLDWLKQSTSASDHPVCRILTNARCLSEGVDVPTLDAVLFLNPRKSQVDVIQAVGRVMRRAAGKEFGYIILPVAVPAGIPPEQALNDNERFKVVWQVLQAIRAHDDRFDAMINAIQYNANAPENIIVDVVDFSRGKKRESDLFDGEASDEEYGADTPLQMPLSFPAEEWKDAVYSRIVKKVGDRLYWADWSKDIADIANRYTALINSLLDDEDHRRAFDAFVEGLQAALNPTIDQSQAIEMLAQHLITKPLFDAMFEDQAFTEKNPVSRAMESIVTKLASNSRFDREREPLDAFYSTMVQRIRQIDNLAGKQDIMRTLYDQFFSKAFAKMADRLGIVFTPVEVVDYIIRSANVALKESFGKTLGDSGVSIIEPFVGTGTFVARLLQTGVIAPEQMEHKYKHELFANEVVLLSYYIASINIEAVYRQQRIQAGFPDEYAEFEGISLVDTFQLHESDGTVFGGVPGLEENSERALRQKNAPIRVIIMNPPYSAGQGSANDDNQNQKYDQLDARIAATYAAKSTAQNKNGLYDSYYRALRWATDRIGDEGVIAFVSNNAFIDSVTADGVRLTWQDEFSQIWIYNLKGNQRTQGERSRREGGKIFGSGARTGVAITVFVKSREHSGPATIHYAEVDDYLARQEKIGILENEGSIAGTEFQVVEPNEYGDWINQRDENYYTYQPIGDKDTKGREATPGIFRLYSRGLATSRDAWCYNFSRARVEANMRRMIENYNREVDQASTKETANTDPMLISWNRQLFRDLERRKHHAYSPDSLTTSAYRPFCKQAGYFNPAMNDMVYQLPQLFPTPIHRNLAFSVKQAASPLPFAALMMDVLPDLSVQGASSGCQIFALFTWENHSLCEGGLDLFSIPESEDHNATHLGSQVLDFTQPIGDQIPQILNGYVRRDNITDATLEAYRANYQDQSITKEEIFFYVYALLYHPGYRERYEANLTKVLPRIPLCVGFAQYARVGRELANLHVNYEQVDPYPLTLEWAKNAPTDPWERYWVTRPTWGKGKDRTVLRYNAYLTIRGIPEEEGDYVVGGRSPLDWVIDRYKVSTHKQSQITNDPNDYCREIGNPAYIVELITRLVTVSVRTQELLQQLPPFEVMNLGQESGGL